MATISSMRGEPCMAQLPRIHSSSLDTQPTQAKLVRLTTVTAAVFRVASGYTFSAGNTSDSLDDTAKFGDRYLPTSQSSEGFIIGATEGGDTARANFSSYGTRIDANGWGRNVATLGYGNLFQAGSDDLQDYTATFSGTSSAAPSVAGVIAALVGAVHEQNGQLLTIAQVRAALATTGTPIPGPENIGNRPRLDQLLAAFGLPDGLLVTQQATVGGSFTYEVRGSEGEIWGLLLASRRGTTATPWNRPILLEVTRMFAYAGGTLPAGGVLTQTDPVPNDPVLRGADFFLQAGFARNGTVHVSNSAELLIE